MRPLNPSSSTPQIHHHVFDSGNQAGERGTRLVMVITALMMVVEIVAGWWAKMGLPLLVTA